MVDGYTPLRGTDEPSVDIMSLTHSLPLPQNITPRHPSRSQTLPATRHTSYTASEPLRPRPTATPLQAISHDDQKSETQSNRRRSSVQSWKQRLRGFVTPSLHDLADSFLIAPDTNRPYIHNRQRWRLWRLTIGEFGITMIFSLAYFLLLYGWSLRSTIDSREKQIFNALSTGLSLILGLNLAGSLRSYAKLLRWRMLAAAYRPLETFDLILGCDSQINVLRLLWKARNSRFRYLPSRTQVFCVLWLLINLVTTALISSIGLTYNIDTSNRFVLFSTGQVSVLDFSALLSENYLLDLSSLHTWGIAGAEMQQNVDVFDYADAQEGFYQTDLNGFAQYFFIDMSADESVYDISRRYVGASANCTSYNATEGIYGNLTYVIYENGSEKVNQTFLVPSGPAGLSFATSTNSTCGTRCTDLIAFQAIPLPDDDTSAITIPAVFVCQNSVNETADDNGNAVPPYGRISDELARMLAGAIGWSGIPLPSADSPIEYMSYPESSLTGFSADPAATDIQGLIADFTIGALAALDYPNLDGPRTYVDGMTPSQAEYLSVKWWHAGALLITIPCLHFITLFIVIHWANRAIIKDDSHLAAAKLYHSLLTRKDLANHGCMLRGEEIVGHMGNPMVAYGWSEKAGINHTDIFIEGDGMDTEVRFKEGRYDGYDWGSHKDVEATPERSVNAGDYF